MGLTREQRVRFGLSLEPPPPYVPISDTFVKQLNEANRKAVQIVTFSAAVLCAVVISLCLLDARLSKIVVIALLVLSNVLLVLSNALSLRLVWSERSRRT